MIVMARRKIDATHRVKDVPSRQVFNSAQRFAIPWEPGRAAFSSTVAFASRDEIA